MWMFYFQKRDNRSDFLISPMSKLLYVFLMHNNTNTHAHEYTDGRTAQFYAF